MPTARELIEQADALMRRNRSQAERTGDVVHASPMPPVGALSDAEPPAPVRDALGALRADAPANEDVPLLTEAVATGASGAGDASAEDVPLLTDAIEEIEAPPAPEADDETDPEADVGAWRIEGTDEGQVSEWRIDEEDASVFARAPLSFMGAPAPVARTTDVPIAKPADEAPVRDATERVAEADAASGRDATPAAAPDAGADAIDNALGLDRTHEIGAPPQAAAPAAGEAASEPPLRGADAERWDAMAEEIRMQVLQRIDIFTDTGLRERLGERLKPVVDRASADLVATINQHVGDLLRAYVAEAIEREIEKWRQENAGR